MTTFRIHFASGEKRVIEADSPADAAEKAKGGGQILKVKRVKDQSEFQTKLDIAGRA